MISQKNNTYLYILVPLIFLLTIVNIFLFYKIIGGAIFVILVVGIIISVFVYFILKYKLSTAPKFIVSASTIKDMEQNFSKSTMKQKQLAEIISKTNYTTHKRILIIEIIIIIILLVNLVFKLLSNGG